MILTQSKTEFLTDAFIEQVNNLWKLNITKFGSYSKLEYSVGKKYIKVKQIRMHRHDLTTDNGVFMFIDKESGACYKPASFKAPAKGIRFFLESLVDNPEIVDAYGSFLYRG
tara:strand:- start:1792 stop:2127 length:336 start_codon:yes stop_codon:yes gene_type:complete